MARQWRALRPFALKTFGNHLQDGKLKRCLNSWDATSLGVGSSLGIGVYVLLGQVAAHTAGPAVVLSFLIAAVAALLAGLCYAELGVRVPRAGGAYIYTYVAISEFAAFLVGWIMILEGIFGTASIAKGLSLHIDSMANGAMSAWFTEAMPLSDGSVFTPYFDLFAFAVVLVFGLLLILGAKASTVVNSIFVIVNVIIVVFAIIAGATQANSNHWSIEEPINSTNATINYGKGGFFPYGVLGTLQGAAICFYGFVGFDTINSAAEEIRDPHRTIPSSILISMVIVFLFYSLVSIVSTMMVPYHSMGSMVALVGAFNTVGMEWGGWVVSVGAVFGICSCLFGAMFPVPRLLYAMASDRLLLHWLDRISTKRKVPVVATVVSTCFIALVASLVELQQLILMVCAGTLLSFTMVAICVIVLRYRSEDKDKSYNLKQLFGCGDRTPSVITARIVDLILFLFISVCVALSLLMVHTSPGWIEVILLHIAAFVLLIIMALLPRRTDYERYQTPAMPVVPCISIYVNIHLMILIDSQTWTRVGVWTTIGILVYLMTLCFYKKDKKLEEITSKGKEPNGTAAVEIVVEPPIRPDTVNKLSALIEESAEKFKEVEEIEVDQSIKPYEVKDDEITIESAITPVAAQKENEIVLQSAIIENNEEKEAIIINLLDKVLEAEEENYEIISLKEIKHEYVAPEGDPIPHRKSFSDLSDAGSDASLGNQGLSKYDVIAQVHREDLPQVREEEEKADRENNGNGNYGIQNDDETKNEEKIDSQIEKDTDENENQYSQNDAENEVLINNEEQITVFDDSDSRTDESGYSDTLDKNVLSDSHEDTKYEEAPYIPPPPPLDENYFANPFIKAYTLPLEPIKLKAVEAEKTKRESVKSNSSVDDSNIVFGSERQKNFMSKLDTILLTKLGPESEEPREPKRRSNSTGDMIDSNEFNIALNRERPAIFYDLKNELMSALAAQSTPHLKPINSDDSNLDKSETSSSKQDEMESEDLSMSRNELRSKLEDIFASGGPKPFKPKLMKSNPPTPEEAYQTDSSTENTLKLPKMEKNDTLKRQKDKFGEVLNSFRMSLNKDDVV